MIYFDYRRDYGMRDLMHPDSAARQHLLQQQQMQAQHHHHQVWPPPKHYFVEVCKIPLDDFLGEAPLT